MQKLIPFDYSLKDTDKEIIVSTLTTILNKLVIDKLGLFFNIYAFLLFEIYDHVHHKGSIPSTHEN